MENWKEFFKENCNVDDLVFFDPITQDQLSNLETTLGFKISGDLLEALQQTNGIRDFRYFYLFSSELIIGAYEDHVNYLKMGDFEAPCKILFFADNGCGEGFGLRLKIELLKQVR